MEERTWYIHIKDKDTNKDWFETYDSFYQFRKRIKKLRYSTTLEIISRSSMSEY